MVDELESFSKFILKKPQFPNDLQEEYDLRENFQEIFPEFHEKNATAVQTAISAYESGNLRESARLFRIAARDIQFTDDSISQRGNLSPKNTLNDLTGKEWIRHTKSWFVQDGKAKDISHDIKNHPGSFPPEVAQRFIEFFSHSGQWVCDPFMGIGSTAIAALRLNRHCFGMELNQKYCDIAVERCNQLKSSSNRFEAKTHIITGDSREIDKIWNENGIPPQSLIITSPPYWTILQKSRGGVKSAQKQRIENGFDEIYSHSELDLGNIESYHEYLQEIQSIFRNLKKILAPSAYLIIIVQNCRIPSGDMRPLAWDLAQRLKDDFKLLQEFIWCQDQKFAGIWGFPTTYVSNLHHHYCLIVQNTK